MRFAKKRPVTFTAFQLGQNSLLEAQMIQAGRIRTNGTGVYEVFSQEARAGKGEIVHSSDYVKIDSKGYPYPNKKDFFEASCVSLGENQYQQIGTPVEVWFADDPMSDFILFLLNTHQLHIDPSNDAQYFQAELFGAPLSAARSAAVIAYAVRRDPDGSIVDVDFNFVERGEFEKTYEWC